jgi:hypothetical protein
MAVRAFQLLSDQGVAFLMHYLSRNDSPNPPMRVWM